MSATKDQEWIDTRNTPERRILDLGLIGMRHALVLGKLRYRKASAPLPEQRHDHWLSLQFVLSGQQLIIVEGQPIVVRGGEMIRLLPGQTYGTGSLPEQKGEMAWLILSLDPLPDEPALGMSANGLRSVYTTLVDPAAPMVVPMPPDVPGLLKSAFGWWSRRDEDLGRETIRNRISSLVLSSAAMFTSEVADRSDHANEMRVRRVIRWMTDHAHEDVSVEILSNMSGLSAARFHHHFKRVTGSSPRDWWLRERVEQAARKLADQPDLTVTDVAHQFGFSSSQYFATVFRRYLGTTPQAFREGLAGEKCAS
jgi:AraC-like DNA-binding protein